MKAKRKTKNDILKILEDTYNEYIVSTDIMFYRLIINKKGLSTTAFCNWKVKNDEDIIYWCQLLDDYQESLLFNELIKKNGMVNTTGAIFTLKSFHKAIEYERWLHLELEKLKTTSIDKPQDFSININYSPIPSRSEDDINALLEVK